MNDEKLSLSVTLIEEHKYAVVCEFQCMQRTAFKAFAALANTFCNTAEIPKDELITMLSEALDKAEAYRVCDGKQGGKKWQTQ